jgi:chemotaxis protein methyltransferase CheR
MSGDGKGVMRKTLSTVTDAEYGELRDYLSSRTGLNLTGGRGEDLRDVVSERIAKRHRGCDFPSYFSDLLAAGDEDGELQYLVGRLTVGETHFFRNRPHFEALQQYILPELIRRRRGKTQHLRIWSAGCSTGEEPYSLAMLLLRMLPDLAEWAVSILATDISEEALAAARKGHYRDWSFREVEEFYQRRFFTPEDKGWQIGPEVREMVTFRHLNLADDLFPTLVTQTDNLDLIICRNVMIYFNVDLSLEITKRFYRCLGRGGHMIVGHSEHSDMVCPKFLRKSYGHAVYYRKEATEAHWERGLKPRFRGSGRPDPSLVSSPGSGFRKRAGQQRPSDTEETVLFESAVTAYRQKDMSASLEKFRQTLKLNPRNERATYMTTLLLADTGDLDGAEKRALKLLESNPLHLEVIYLLAMIYRMRSDGDREIEYLRKAVYIDQGFILGHFQMGMFYLRGGNERLARRSLLNVLDLLVKKEDSDPVEGVDGLSVDSLRTSIGKLIPGPAERP